MILKLGCQVVINIVKTHSCSSFGDFQARRSNIKYKDKDGTTKYCFSLNNTAIASPRILIPLLELNQNEDGSINIPEVLVPYMGGMKKIEKKINNKLVIKKRVCIEAISLFKIYLSKSHFLGLVFSFAVEYFSFDFLEINNVVLISLLSINLIIRVIAAFFISNHLEFSFIKYIIKHPFKKNKK